MADDELILAIDGGGTASRAGLYHEDGTVAAETMIGPLSRKSSSAETVSGSLAELRGFLGSDVERVRCAAFGLSGLDSAEDVANMGELLSDAGLCAKGTKPRKFSYGHRCTSSWDFPILLCSDALLPLFANGYASGSVVISGTGSVALRIGADGSVERFGGWGYMVSDEGSGTWVGCELARNALHAADDLLSGRVPASKMPKASKSLLEEAFLAMRAQWKSRVPESSTLERKAEFIREWATAHDDPKDFASMAKSVIRSKSAACREISEHAAERLAWLASRACVNDAPVVVVSGGLFKNPGFARRVGTLTKQMSDVSRIEFVVNELMPAIGAFELAKRVF